MKIQSQYSGNPVESILIPPFTRPLNDIRIVDKSLAEWQARALKDNKVIADPDKKGDWTLDWDRSLFFTSDFLRTFLKDSKKATGPVQAVVALGLLHKKFGPNLLGLGPQAGSNLSYPMKLRPTRNGADDVFTQIQVPAVDLGRVVEESAINYYFALVGEGNLIWKIGHWSDLLTLNLLVARRETSSIEKGGTRGKNASIHPSAVVKNCRIGKNVIINPFAVVRDSIIGDDVTIEPHAVITGSYVGSGTVINSFVVAMQSVVGQNCRIFYRVLLWDSVVGDDSLVESQLVRTITGRKVFVGGQASLAALHLEHRPILVVHQGARKDTGLEMLGSAIGDGARLGKISLSPGCEVPSEVFLTETMVGRIPETLEKGVIQIESNGAFRSFALKRNP